MRTNIRQTTVEGTTYECYSDFDARGTFATNTETNETKQISFSGYIRNDLTVRKAIAIHFKHKTFRK